MKYTTYLILIFLPLQSLYLQGQTVAIQGTATLSGQPSDLIVISIDSSRWSTTTNTEGRFSVEGIPVGKHHITASYLGYVNVSQEFLVDTAQKSLMLRLDLNEPLLQLDNVVVTGTKTSKRQTNSAVIVNVINSETINNIQACNLSEGLRFQPGLRVETDCQTCNYTQLRMNGLAGGYSQILINGRPIFSPLTGLYGMEQLPANMIDRIEVVRGGGSSLYGSSAIGGTVNVISKVPRDNSYELNYTYQNIDRQTNDHTFSANTTLVNKRKNIGASIYFNKRERGLYDANKDNFSEIPLIDITSLGSTLFILPKDNQKLELNLSRIEEYRYGGEMVKDVPAFQSEQAEERTHRIWMGSADYQINFNRSESSFISYIAWQHTDRAHYTGIRPDEGSVEYDLFLSNLPYGTSDVSTFNAGIQLNHNITNFLKGSNVLTLGGEYLYDAVYDAIPAYKYLVDQTTTDIGIFLQSDWAITPALTLLSGVRMDRHNLLDKIVFSPRTSLLYKHNSKTQFRVSYGSGFRAPQAFDTDLHIAFAGGGVSRVLLSSNLTQENSHSISTSVNYDYPSDKWIAGFTLEGFYNRLNQAFFLQATGEDQFGQIFEKQNGDGANVQGVTLELRANYNRKIQLESGVTLQTSRFDNVVRYVDDIAGIRDFVRTPNEYAYGILTINPSRQWNTTINYIYTGSMVVPHFAGSPNQLRDEMVHTTPFSELSLNMSYTLPFKQLANNIELYGGIKNLFNAYQNDFDIGKNRDSNYIYGPAQPRTFYIGLKLRSR